MPRQSFPVVQLTRPSPVNITSKSYHMNEERLADTGAAASIFLWLTSRALEWMPILQAISLIVAITAGALAAMYHARKLNQ